MPFGLNKALQLARYGSSWRFSHPGSAIADIQISMVVGRKQGARAAHNLYLTFTLIVRVVADPDCGAVRAGRPGNSLFLPAVGSLVG